MKVLSLKEGYQFARKLTDLGTELGAHVSSVTKDGPGDSPKITLEVDHGTYVFAIEEDNFEVLNLSTFDWTKYEYGQERDALLTINADAI